MALLSAGRTAMRLARLESAGHALQVSRKVAKAILSYAANVSRKVWQRR